MRRFLIAVSITVGVACAQAPRIGVIDFYGLHQVRKEKVLKALGVRIGGELPRSKVDAEQAIEKVRGVVRARLQAVCCQAGKAILYVGIEERGAPHFELHEVPEAPVLLPPEIHDTYVQFLAAVRAAAQANDTAEDLTNGYSLMRNPGARKYQEQFLVFARRYLPVIRDVLRHSMNEEHRAIAAYVIGYAPDKKAVVADLLYAVRDPDPTVRDNAMRSLTAIEVLARLKPTLGIKIPPTWLIEMLNSIVWTDRTKAAANLVTLTDLPDPEVLAQLRERALPALIDMARWKHLLDALPAYILLGRVLGMKEAEIRSAWSGKDRRKLIEKAIRLEARRKHKHHGLF